MKIKPCEYNLKIDMGFMNSMDLMVVNFASFELIYLILSYNFLPLQGKEVLLSHLRGDCCFHPDNCL